MNPKLSFVCSQCQRQCKTFVNCCYGHPCLQASLMVPQALHQLRERTPTILCFIFTFLQYFYYSIQIAYVLFRTVLTLHSLYCVIIHPQHRLPLLTMMFLPQPESWDYGHGPSYLVKFLKVFLVTCYYICEYLPLTTHLTEETQDEKNLILPRASNMSTKHGRVASS